MDRQAKCRHRSVADDGRVLCSKISRGDREVSLTVCAACPAAQCNCAHLRFSLERSDAIAVVVRYGNGKTVVWDDRPRSPLFSRAACVARDMPIASPGDCFSCPQHVALLPNAPAVRLEPVAPQAHAPDPGQARRLAGAVSAGTMGKVIPFPSVVNPFQLGAP